MIGLILKARGETRKDIIDALKENIDELEKNTNQYIPCSNGAELDYDFVLHPEDFSDNWAHLPTLV